ncbi:MAG TPA: septum formation initiator family protein [Vicinamibacterales bacterium]
MKLALACAACILLFALFGDDHGLPAVLQTRHDAQRLHREISRLRHENTALRREAQALRVDPAAIEFEARAALGLVRPGEVVVTRQRASTVR